MLLPSRNLVRDLVEIAGIMIGRIMVSMMAMGVRVGIVTMLVSVMVWTVV